MRLSALEREMRGYSDGHLALLIDYAPEPATRDAALAEQTRRLRVAALGERVASAASLFLLAVGGYLLLCCDPTYAAGGPVISRAADWLLSGLVISVVAFCIWALIGYRNPRSPEDQAREDESYGDPGPKCGRDA